MNRCLNEPLSEDEIFANWIGDENFPLVSICCTTYNHENYITYALNGFLSQVTSFPFEILLHDDASTDGTRQIVEQYVKKYPRIIKPIFQVENQYSKGKKVSFEFNFPRATGKYIAFCEGDDYWIDKDKLSKQVNFLEEMDFVSIVVTNAYTERNGKRQAWTYTHEESFGYHFFTIHDVLKTHGQFSPSASMVFRKSVVDYIIKNDIPAPVGDFLIEAYSFKLGIGIFLDDVTCVYRIQTGGSWSKMMLRNPAAVRELNIKMIQLHERIKKDFPVLSSKIFESRNHAILKSNVVSYISEGSFEECKKHLENLNSPLPFFYKLIRVKFLFNLARIFVSLKRKLVSSF